MQKIRIGVLMGGKSLEREVSFNSGRTICDHLDTTCFDIVPLFQTRDNQLYLLPWNFLYRGKIADFEHKLDRTIHNVLWHELKNYVDFIYIAQHGKYAEDGTLQGFLELLKIPYHGSKVCASALGMDKIIQKKFLSAAGIGVAREVIVPAKNFEKKIILKELQEKNIFFPCIVKPRQEGSSIGVQYVNNEAELWHAINHAQTITQHQQKILIEEKIEGMEFSCIVLTDQQGNFFALPPTEIIKTSDKKIFDYEQKYMPGKSLQCTPARCSKSDLLKIQEVACKTAQTLEFSNMARVDGFLTPDGNVIIIDPNTFSGAAPSSFMFKQAAHVGMNHSQLISYIIETELKAYGMKDRLTTYINTLQSHDPKLRVAVIMGGASHEREISLESGRNVVYKLSPIKYEVIPLFLDDDMQLYTFDTQMLVCNSTAEIKHMCTPALNISWTSLKNIADFIFIALHGGAGENGCIQGALELLQLPYNGSSVLTSALCMNKYKTNILLKYAGFDVPEHVFISENAWKTNSLEYIKNIEKKISFPCVVKPHDDGCSIGVYKVEHKESLCEAIEKIFQLNKEYVLVEEFIQGMELTVGVLGNQQIQVLPPSWTVTNKAILSIEEKFLPGAGENQTPAPLAPETLKVIQDTIAQVYQTVEARGYARIDCFYQTSAQSKTGKERLIILEINTLPALTPATCLFHQAAEIGLKPRDFIDNIIQLGLQEHAHNCPQLNNISSLNEARATA